MKIHDDHYEVNISGHAKTYSLIRPDGQKRFGKFASATENKTDWKSPWKEYFSQTVQTYMGIIELNPEIKIHEGRLAVERDDLPETWVRQANSNILEAQSFFSAIVIVDELLNQSDRPKSKDEHIRLIPMGYGANFIPAPIDNENCLENLNWETTLETISARFGADDIKDKQTFINKVSQMSCIPVGTIASETTRILLSTGSFSSNTTEEIYRFSCEVVVKITEKQIELSQKFIEWIEQKIPNTETQENQTTNVVGPN